MARGEALPGSCVLTRVLNVASVTYSSSVEETIGERLITGQIDNSSQLLVID